MGGEAATKEIVNFWKVHRRANIQLEKTTMNNGTETHEGKDVR